MSLPRLCACAFLVLLLVSMAAAPLPAEPIEIGERVSLWSETLDEDRPLLVYLPESYRSSDFRYPVLYLLDGDFEFLHTVGIVEFLAGTGQIPELIVVGISNTHRSRDLTPPSEDEDETAFWPAVGGADAFLEFIRSELAPFLEEEYRTVGYRILRGQSFGGLLAIHDFMSGQSTFHAYLTSSPAVGWNFDELIRRAPEFFARGIPRPLYVAASSDDFPGNLDGIRRFADAIAEQKPDSSRWRFDFFEGESHYSLVHLATYRALKFLYQPWQVPASVASSARFEDYERHYANLSRRYGYSITIPMQTVVQLGNDLLRAKRYADGIRVLERNLDIYPNQPESHWHVGEGYRLSGQLQKAVGFLTVALAKARERRSPDVDFFEESLRELRLQLESERD